MKKLNPKTWFVLCVVLVCGVLVYSAYQKIKADLMNKALDDLIANAPDIPITEPAVPEGKPVFCVEQLQSGRGIANYKFCLYKNLVVVYQGISDVKTEGEERYRIPKNNFLQIIYKLRQFQSSLKDKSFFGHSIQRSPNEGDDIAIIELPQMFSIQSILVSHSRYLNVVVPSKYYDQLILSINEDGFVKVKRCPVLYNHTAC